jgi:hypothetical protein
MCFDPDGQLARRASKMESQVAENCVTDSFPCAEWQKACQAALVELDQGKLPERIAAAEAAIVSRLNATSALPVSPVEHQAIADALAALRALKRECMGSSREEAPQ